MPKDEPVSLRHVNTFDIIPDRLKRATIAQYLTDAIEHATYLDEMRKWAKQPDFELREDTTGYVPFSLGESIWAIINNVTHI